jgi:hypothetical protein
MLIIPYILLKSNLPQISARELNTTAADLEYQLSRIFEIACYWYIFLLLDKADIYIEQQSTQDLVCNSLVSVFLTTNRVSQFDIAILSRVYLILKYNNLSKEAGKKIWEQFIERAGIGQGSIKADKLNCLVNNKLNSRQVNSLLYIYIVFN